jgi:hypothetical protein
MKPNQQERRDQVPTVTEKSSGIEYLKSDKPDLGQGASGPRQTSTKNDGRGK